MSLAFLFPGQGSQAIGMGVELAEAFAPAREVFQEVDDALGQKLSKLMREGPEGDLTLTENAQPALMAVLARAGAQFVREHVPVFEHGIVQDGAVEIVAQPPLPGHYLLAVAAPHDDLRRARALLNFLRARVIAIVG